MDKTQPVMLMPGDLVVAIERSMPLSNLVKGRTAFVVGTHDNPYPDTTVWLLISGGIYRFFRSGWERIT